MSWVIDRKTLQRVAADGTPLTEVRVRVRSDSGHEMLLGFDHDPTHDEIRTAMPSEEEVVPTDVTSRRELVIEWAQRWVAIDAVATYAADPLSGTTAQQRQRIAQVRDAVWQRLLGFA